MSNASAIESHVAGPLESKPAEFGYSRLLWRQTCRCGFIPMWERTIGHALEAAATHFNRGTR